MHERVHVEVTKGDPRTNRLPAEGHIGIGEDGSGVVKEVIQEVVLEVNAGERLAVMMLYCERLSVVAMWTVRG